MIASWLVGLAAVATGGHGDGACGTCGAEPARIDRLILALQTAPVTRWRVDAAHDLREFGGPCHPEVVDALAGALLADCEDRVRKEAAQSLKKIGACTPASHAALARAAASDPKLLTRFWARRALAEVRRACPGTCAVCTPSAIVAEPAIVGPALISPPIVVGPGLPADPSPGPALVEPLPAPEPGLTPTTLPNVELPPPLPRPARSPFRDDPPPAGPALDGPVRSAARDATRPSAEKAAADDDRKSPPKTRRIGLLGGVRDRIGAIRGR